jgi:hypothetical protein
MTTDTMDRSTLATAMTAVGDTLAARGGKHEVVLVGGGNLLLRGIISRSTRDGDLLGLLGSNHRIIRIEKLPADLAEAVRDVAEAYNLRPDWLNVGPRAILDRPLPAGFYERLERQQYGTGLVVWFAGLYDQICFKLHAAADAYPLRDRHVDDLARLEPTRVELISAAKWTLAHDESPGYRLLLVETLKHLGIEDADDVLSR